MDIFTPPNLMIYKISILGAGSWGLAMAALLSENGHQVQVWEYDPHFLQGLNVSHANPALLPDLILPSSVTFTGDFAAVLAYQPDFLILATPSQFLRATLQKYQA
ncbi:MAG: NAD(P)-binding protein, partial [Candidatus Cloacimonadaceae bacterium]|nr:NAD(P)-binding protein [Candidatus Cloacimonadaceae bacterium]